MFPTSGSKVKRWFSDVWVPKLWLCPKKIGCLAYKQPFCHQQHVCLYDRRKRKQSYRTSGTTVMADNITIIEIATFSTPTGLAKHHHHQHPILMRTSTLGELQKSLWQQCHYCQNYHHQQLCLPLGEQITWKTMYLFCVYFHIFLSQNINDQQSSTLLHAAHHCK